MNQKALTLNLSEREMLALEELAEQTDTSKSAVLRRALRLYQLHYQHAVLGGTVQYHGGLTPGPLALDFPVGEPR